MSDTLLDERADTIVETRVAPQVAEPGDHERFAHFVKKVDQMMAALTGEPATALCGKKWVPTRNPDNFPICPRCRELYLNNDHMSNLDKEG